ncbi:MAG: ccoG [Bacteroidota bacterium]|nr:ccoG [Bacteroidota bacterium]
MNGTSEIFRDSIGTITDKGSRNWIFARKPEGRLYNARTIVSIVYLFIFFTLPWIKVNGEPLFMLNFIQRKFILVGVIFWPQDFFVFVIGMLTFLVFIVLFTVVYGRIFCGWVCPQTIFMEMIFRKIEYWIDGNSEKQKALAKSAWNGNKIFRRSAKFIAFFLMSFIIANYFMAYLIGMDHVLQYMKQGIVAHLDVFIPLVAFTSVFFFVYWWFREQVCLIVCPYGRLQGVMMDPNSIVVAYDYVRGEPRGKVKKEEPAKLGDCVDCKMCVQVCPTGIDIRYGTQLECINCTACIDACDSVMDHIHRPKGLIRYASENNIAKGERLKMTPRTYAYSAVLVILLTVLGILLFTRKDIQATVMRVQGMLYQEQANDKISNLYNIKLINKTRKDLPVTLKVEDGDLKGEIKTVGNELIVKRESLGDGVFFIMADKQNVRHRKNAIKIGVYSGGRKIEEVKTNFMGPGSR